MNRDLRILIVDDSAFIRRVLSNIFSQDGSFTQIDTAQNGKIALEKLAQRDYDVITLDVEMPVMDGIRTLKKIMATKKTPVVMLSSLTSKGAKITMEALEIGAVDFVTKPQNLFSTGGSELANEIRRKVKLAARINVQSMWARSSIRKPYDLKKADYTAVGNEVVKKIIAIGTSTGGPRALHEVVPEISGDIGAPILIVQHMPKGFTKSLADRLNSFSKVYVKEAQDGETLRNGVAYIAPGGIQLKISSYEKDRYKVKLEDSPPVNGHKPSVDAMMESVADSTIDSVVAVIMTGMGGDGARGLARLKDVKKAATIAEDEKTCVVYGMPKIAAQTGRVDKVLMLQDIAGEINKLMGV